MIINNKKNVFQRLSKNIVKQSALYRVHYNMKLLLIHDFYLWLKLETSCLVDEFGLGSCRHYVFMNLENNVLVLVRTEMFISK